MNRDELIKKLELLEDNFDSNHALEMNGYSQGVNDAIDLVKKMNYMQSSIQLPSKEEISLGNIKATDLDIEMGKKLK